MVDFPMSNAFFSIPSQPERRPEIDVETLDADAQARVREAMEKALDVYGDMQKAKDFLLRRSKDLGEPPLNASAASPERHEKVIERLIAIDYGLF